MKILYKEVKCIILIISEENRLCYVAMCLIVHENLLILSLEVYGEWPRESMRHLSRSNWRFLFLTVCQNHIIITTTIERKVWSTSQFCLKMTSRRTA